MSAESLAWWPRSWSSEVGGIAPRVDVSA